MRQRLYRVQPKHLNRRYEQGGDDARGAVEKLADHPVHQRRRRRANRRSNEPCGNPEPRPGQVEQGRAWEVHRSVDGLREDVERLEEVRHWMGCGPKSAGREEASLEQIHMHVMPHGKQFAALPVGGGGDVKEHHDTDRNRGLAGIGRRGPPRARDPPRQRFAHLRQEDRDESQKNRGDLDRVVPKRGDPS